MPKQRSAIIPGLLLVLIGGWLLAQNLGVALPGLQDLWPAIILLFGLSMLAQFFAGGRKDEGLVFVGMASTLLGAFFMSITLGPLTWGDLGDYWPVFPLIGGIAFLAQWLVRPSERGLLIPAGMGLIVGTVALLFTVGNLDPGLAGQIARLWPVLLILAGLGMLVSFMRRPGSSN